MIEETFHIPPPCEQEVDLIHRDEDILVVNKPEGLLTVPGKVVKDCVLHRMLVLCPTASIVHRLDLDTSGLLVLALSKPASSDLNRSFRDREVQKEYVAVVDGVMKDNTGIINLPVNHDPERRPRQKVDKELGKEAITHFEVIERDANLKQSRLLLKPVTGRTHQLRLHLAAIGYPILGCDLYAPDEVLAMADRLLLHASRLAFKHPVTHKFMSFDSVPEF